MNRVAAFIDGPNAYGAARALGVDLDYKAVLSWLRCGCPSDDGPGQDTNLIRATYFTTVLEDEGDYVSIKPLLDWLEYNGFALVTKPTRLVTDSMGRTRTKGSMDVEMAVAMLTAARDWSLDDIALVSGDGDLVPAVRAAQACGVRVTVVAALTKVQPAMVSDDLRRAADRFVDLANVIDQVGRNPADRRVRVERATRAESGGAP